MTLFVVQNRLDATMRQFWILPSSVVFTAAAPGRYSVQVLSALRKPTEVVTGSGENPAHIAVDPSSNSRANILI